ncbi:MAG: FliA/WhiG family RNA polymerase sigma factor [Deltaproteobacteria bacterium HGW-Deltaproteobacteria-14]|jgi:RNA polymerase sigma factor for flagellar operon FliA|nr:MAG: FliA/WhiG family RNA polymerase sigma factor [Deltaproteobacteria bacterium HGW-Deltaproteobacteria-14]
MSDDPSTEPPTPPLDRATLVKEHMRLVKQVASKIAARLPPNVELDDLIGSGMIGLLDAVDKFDQAKSSNFKKYAEIRIKGAILDELRAMDHVSRTVRRQSSQLNQEVRKLQDTLGRKASAEETAEHLGMDLRGYHELMNKLKPVLVVSFDDLTEDKSRDPFQFLADPNARDPQAVLHVKKVRELVNSTLDSLKDRQRLVVRFYYYDGMTLKEIGKILGVSESRISQMLTQATNTIGRRLKAQLRSEGLALSQLE